MGAGGDPEVGNKAAQEDKDRIASVLKGADMVFVTAGMGGGTGTGAAPVIAEIAKELKCLVVGVVTLPFGFEGRRRNDLAKNGLNMLRQNVDTLITIKNDSTFKVVDKKAPIDFAFRVIDDILLNAVKGLSDIINHPGIINVDFADIRSVMHNAGSALMGIGVASGEKRAEEAAQMAINSPLLEVSISGAKGVLFAIAGGDDLGMLEVQDAARIITDSIDPNARVIFGAIKDEKLKKNEIKVTVIATGFPEDSLPRSNASLFGIGSRPAREREKEEVGVIHNSLMGLRNANQNNNQPTQQPAPVPMGNDINKVERKPREEKPAEEPRHTPIKEDDDDEWGVPSFLRRSKIK
jgi:cell division protein FtsZ